MEHVQCRPKWDIHFQASTRYIWNGEKWPDRADGRHYNNDNKNLSTRQPMPTFPSGRTTLRTRRTSSAKTGEERGAPEKLSPERRCTWLQINGDGCDIANPRPSSSGGGVVGSVPAGGSGLVKDVTRTSRAWNANSGRESFFPPPAATGRRSKENASCYGKDFNAATKHASDEPPRTWETFAARLSLIAVVRKAEQKSDALPYAKGERCGPKFRLSSVGSASSVVHQCASVQARILPNHLHLLFRCTRKPFDEA